MPNLNHLNQSHPGELQVLPAATRLAHGVENAAALLDVGRTTVFEYPCGEHRGDVQAARRFAV